MTNHSLPEYSFTRFGIAIPWEARLFRTPPEFTPEERLKLTAKLCRSNNGQYYFEPLHDDPRYVDRFYLTFSPNIDSGMYTIILKIILLRYRNIINGYGNDYIAEVLDFEKNKLELPLTTDTEDGTTAKMQYNSNFNELLLNSPQNILNLEKLQIQRFFEQLAETTDNIILLEGFLNNMVRMDTQLIYHLRFIVLLVCKSLFFIVLKILDTDILLALDLNLLIISFNLLSSLNGFSLASDYIKGILECFEV